MRKDKITPSLSPLALLTLAACGGGTDPNVSQFVSEKLAGGPLLDTTAFNANNIISTISSSPNTSSATAPVEDGSVLNTTASVDNNVTSATPSTSNTTSASNSVDNNSSSTASSSPNATPVSNLAEDNTVLNTTASVDTDSSSTASSSSNTTSLSSSVAGGSLPNSIPSVDNSSTVSSTTNTTSVSNTSGNEPLQEASVPVANSSSSTASSASNPAPVSGSVEDGPLQNAIAFLDYNDNGLLDVGEPSARTDATGGYSLTPTQENYSIVAITDENTIDTVSGAVVSGITLKAPSGSLMVTPTTTLMEDGNLTASEVMMVLGLPANLNPLTYSAHADVSGLTGSARTAAENLSLQVELANQQILSVVNAFAAAAEGSGVGAADAFEAAIKSVAEEIKVQAATNSTLDLSDQAQLAEIKLNIEAKVDTLALTDTSIRTTEFAATMSETVKATGLVNAKIQEITDTDLSSSATQSILATTQVLKAQVAAAAKATVGNTAGDISFANADGVALAAAATNEAPTDMALSSNSISEASDSLVVGNVSTTDAALADGTASTVFKYAIAKIDGTDHAAFSIDATTGVLSLVAQPDYETQSSYSITILSTDEGGKTLSKVMTVSVTEANNAPTVANTIANQSITEDSALNFQFDADVFADSDVGDTISYVATLADGNALPNWLSFNEDTRTFSGTPENNDVGIIAVKVTATDAESATASDTFNLTVTNTNDTPTVANAMAPQAVTEDNYLSFQLDTNAFEDVDVGDAIAYTATLTDGSALPTWLSFNEDTRTFSGTPTDNDSGIITVKVTASDAASETVSNTFDIKVLLNAAKMMSAQGFQPLNASSLASYDRSNTDMSGAQMENADLGDYNLAGSNLTGANLKGATLTTTDLTGANLTGADLRGVDLTSSVMTNAILTNADLTVNGNTVANLTSANLVGADLTGANLTSTTLTGTGFSVTDSTTGVVTAANLTSAILTGVNLYGLDLTGVNLSGADLTNANLSNVNLTGANLTGTIMTGAILTGAIGATEAPSTIGFDNSNEVNTSSNENQSTTSSYIAKADAASSQNLNPDNNAAIENLMSGYFWGSVGSGIDLTYSFMSTGSNFAADYDGDGSTTDSEVPDNIQNSSTIFQSTVADIFELYSSVSLLSFAEVSDTGDATGHIRIGTTSSTDSAFAYLPYTDSGQPVAVAGDVWLQSTNNSFNDSASLVDGTYWNNVTTHEIGHALGLAHTHEAETIGATTYGTNTQLGSVNNSLSYSVMAYPEYVGGEISLVSIAYKPTTLMIDDIAALQYLYGADTSTNSGDTTYTLGSFSDDNLDTIYASIWDAGGNDTFSWSDQSTIASINLNGGSFSCFGNITGVDDATLKSDSWSAGDGLLGIAYNSVIENAIGGSASDNVVGNGVANTLYGGAGSGVKDTLTGNGGADIFVCSLSDATTDLSLADSISDFTNGTDFIGLEDRTFSDLSILNSAGDTKIIDTSSSKVLFLLDGVDHTLIDSSDFVITDFV